MGSMSNSKPLTVSSSRPIGRFPPALQKAAWWSFRKSSGSTTISVMSPSGLQPLAIPPWRPALFDRTQRGIDIGYDEAAVNQGVKLRAAIKLEDTLLDVGAAIQSLKGAGRIATVGYCWGGSLAISLSNAPLGARLCRRILWRHDRGPRPGETEGPGDAAFWRA